MTDNAIRPQDGEEVDELEALQKPRSILDENSPSTKIHNGFKPKYAVIGLCSCLLVAFLVHTSIRSKSLTNVNVIDQTNRQLQSELPMRGTHQKLIWLISFPESGVTYLSHIIQTLSGRSMATNYGERALDEWGRAVSVRTSIPAFTMMGIPCKMSFTLPIAPFFILTRTHSYGTDFDVPPWEYIGPHSQERHEFVNFYASYMDEGVVKVGTYDRSFVKKVVLLMRDPMDNVVARFYQRVNRETFNRNFVYAQKYPLTKDGFLKYCKDADNDNNRLPRLAWFERAGFADYVSGFPCQEEFVKIFSFHNQVLEMSKKLGLESLLLTTKEFALDFDTSIWKLFHFARLRKESDQKFLFPNMGSKEFFFFFSDDERKAVAHLAKAMLDPMLWDKYSQYLGEYL